MEQGGRWITGIDHVALPFQDLDAATAYYDRLFGVKVVVERVTEGRTLIRQVLIGGALLSMHQEGNGFDLVARTPCAGSGDICLRWSGPIEGAIELLRTHGVEVVEGPAKRAYSNGQPSTSVYFRDLDGNLIELMAPAAGA